MPTSAINTYSEALADPHVEGAGWVQPLTLPDGTRTRTFVFPPRLDGAALPLRGGPPALDAHRAEIFGLDGAAGGVA